MNKVLLTFGSLALCSVCANADNVLFSENFDNDYSQSFPYIYDCDDLEPASSIRALFMGSEGYYMPWWHLKDSSTDTDRFLASHSYYTHGGTSSDWLGSRGIDVPGTGFVLRFGAQSYTLKSQDDKISDLWLFITESPLDKNNLPTTPTAVFEKVPVGESQDIISGDFTYYEVNLDAYAGKTIYLNFANLNTDKEILCLDDITVSRKDCAEMSLQSYEQYTVDNEFTINVDVVGVENVDNYSVTYTDENGSDVKYGSNLAADAVQTFSFVRSINPDQTLNFTVKFDDGKETQSTKTGSVSRLTYSPLHRVLVEESTGAWCGWCPGGISIVENMHADEEMSEYVVAVSVHVGNDNMAMPAYGVNLGAGSSAPMFFVNRTNVGAPSATYDYDFDKTKSGSIAKYVVDRHNASTTLGIDVTGDWVIEGTDTIAINCKATVTPALTQNNANLRVGFILTENNVWMEDSEYFAQQNYLSGKTGTQYLKYWSDMDDEVYNVHYNDVARCIENYSGIVNSLPENLAANTEYEVSHQMQIPDVTVYDKGELIAPAVKCAHTNLVAFVVNTSTGEIVNVAEYPMSDIANNRYTTEMLYESISGINDITVDSADSNAPVQYFDLQGRRVLNPSNGLYIRRQGSATAKVIL